MIYTCPNCGHHLPHVLKDGLVQCTHCHRMCESSDFTKLLSAAWVIRRERAGTEELRSRLGLTEDEAILVNAFVGENCYSHEDFRKVLVKFGVANKSYINYQT